MPSQAIFLTGIEIRAFRVNARLRSGLEFEVRGHKLDRLQDAVELQFLIGIHDIITTVFTGLRSPHVISPFTEVS
jgi:hypothetical protein